MNLGVTTARVLIGGLFAGHGAQKLFGWFGGHGVEGTGGFFETLGLKPGRRHATAAGLAETVGGTLLALGALTPVAASMLSGTMVTAIRKVHARNGVWSTNGGYEYNLVILGALMALSERGPGRPSVDAALLPRLHGRTLAVLQLGAGIAGSYLVTSELVNEGAGAPADRAATDELSGDPAADDEPRFARGGEPVDVASGTTTGTR
jgi:putative oxidoreductase